MVVEDNRSADMEDYDQAIERRQDSSPEIDSHGHPVNLLVPQSPDPVDPSRAPLPPHPYYATLSSHDVDDGHEDDSPENEWAKVRDKIRLKPINHQMFKTNGRHVPTLPYAPTQPFVELQYGIDQIRRAVHKINPMAGLANDVFKKFNIAVKVNFAFL